MPITFPIDGYMRDSWVMAARLDYTVAANLNLFGTFMWAERTRTAMAGDAFNTSSDSQPLPHRQRRLRD